MKTRFLSLTTFGTTGQMSLPGWSAPLLSAFDSFMIKFFKKRYLTFTANYTGLNDESGGAMSKNKKARVVSFKGAGHIANLDKPDEFNQVLLKIVTELYINKEK